MAANAQLLALQQAHAGEVEGLRVRVCMLADVSVCVNVCVCVCLRWRGDVCMDVCVRYGDGGLGGCTHVGAACDRIRIGI